MEDQYKQEVFYPATDHIATDDKIMMRDWKFRRAIMPAIRFVHKAIYPTFTR